MSGVFTLSIDVEGLWGLFFVRRYVDDPRTAEILSKVLHLARDEQIKDPTILEQLRR